MTDGKKEKINKCLIIVSFTIICICAMTLSYYHVVFMIEDPEWPIAYKIAQLIGYMCEIPFYAFMGLYLIKKWKGKRNND